MTVLWTRCGINVSPPVLKAQTRTEIRAALQIIADHKLRGVLVSPRDVEELIDEIRQSGVVVVIGPVKPHDSDRATRAFVALSSRRESQSHSAAMRLKCARLLLVW